MFCGERSRDSGPVHMVEDFRPYIRRPTTVAGPGRLALLIDLSSKCSMVCLFLLTMPLLTRNVAAVDKRAEQRCYRGAC